MTSEELKAVNILHKQITATPKAIAKYHDFFLIVVEDKTNTDDPYYIVDNDKETIVKWTPAYDIDGYLNIVINNLFKRI